MGGLHKSDRLASTLSKTTSKPGYAANIVKILLIIISVAIIWWLLRQPTVVNQYTYYTEDYIPTTNTLDAATLKDGSFTYAKLHPSLLDMLRDILVSNTTNTSLTNLFETTNASTSNTFNETTESTLINQVFSSDDITLGVDTTGDYVADLQAGSGINVVSSGGAGSTPTVSLDSSVAIFKDITTSLGTGVTADSLNDTLAFNGGGGINVIGDGAADAITFDLNLASGGGLMTDGASSLTLLNTCSDGQYLGWASGVAQWACTSLPAEQSLFLSVVGDSGTVSASSSTDTLALTGGNGIITAVSDSPATATFAVNLAGTSGLTFVSGQLSLAECSDGEILRRISGDWQCDSSFAASGYQQQLSGTDNRTLGSSLTPVMTDGAGSAQSVPVARTYGNAVSVTVSAEISTSVTTGPATFVIIRDDDGDGSCSTSGGSGTQIGGQMGASLALVGVPITISFTFVDTAPGTTTPSYQLCASTSIALGTTTVTDRSIQLEELEL